MGFCVIKHNYNTVGLNSNRENELKQQLFYIIPLKKILAIFQCFNKKIFLKIVVRAKLLIYLTILYKYYIKDKLNLPVLTRYFMTLPSFESITK